MKNKIFLFFIFFSNYNVAFAEENKLPIQSVNPKDENDEISRLSKENALLELQMRNKFLKEELEKSRKEDARPQDNKIKDEMSQIDKEIKKIQQEIELLQHKHNLFIAKQADNEEFREQCKKNFEITNKKNELDAKIELAKKEIELRKIEMARDHVIEENKVEYLENPLLKNGTLVLSDRQIHIGRKINSDKARKVENDIDFYNNKNNKLPIFLIFEECGGGYVVDGVKIINKMKYSQAPVYVLVKGFVGSMAAIITTLAKKSFCFENSIIMHHQPSREALFDRSNVREAEEKWKQLKETWERILGPVAKKMGISLDALMKKMYEKNSKGDWREYGNEAKKLHWVDEVITTVRDTSVKVKYKDLPKKKNSSKIENKNQKEQVEYVCKLDNTQ